MPLLHQKTEVIPVWRNVQRENFCRIELLLDFLELSEENRKKVLQKPRFPLNLPRRLAEKIEKNHLDDPIFRQFVPLEEELTITPGYTVDPVEDQTFRKTNRILHKYVGRALIIATGACAMHCRYCFRQNFPYETERKAFDKEIDHISKDQSLREVILSGGDPLSLSDGSLSNLINALEKMEHIQRIRFHTRFPIGIPERIDDSFIRLLESSSKQLFFVIHCNHPQELDADIIFALKRIQKLGIPVLNQSVLLKGVNDDEKTQLSLSEALINGGIVPYYLHLLDPVVGAGHFAIPEERGKQLVDFVRENLSGFGVPRLVREETGNPSKTFKY